MEVADGESQIIEEYYREQHQKERENENRKQ